MSFTEGGIYSSEFKRVYNELEGNGRVAAFACFIDFSEYTGSCVASLRGDVGISLADFFGIGAGDFWVYFEAYGNDGVAFIGGGVDFGIGIGGGIGSFWRYVCSTEADGGIYGNSYNGTVGEVDGNGGVAAFE